MLHPLLVKSIEDYANKVLEAEQGMTVTYDEYIEPSRYVVKIFADDLTILFSLYWKDVTKLCISIYTDINLDKDFSIASIISALVPFMMQSGAKLQTVSTLEYEKNEPEYIARMEIGYELSTAISSVAVIEETVLRIVEIEAELLNNLEGLIEDAKCITLSQGKDAGSEAGNLGGTLTNNSRDSQEGDAPEGTD